MKLVLRPVIVLTLILVALAISWYPWREPDTGTGTGDEVAAPEAPAPPADPPDPRAGRSQRPPPVMSAQDRALAGQVVALVNAERAKARCGAVRPDARLAGAALDHSAGMAHRGYLSNDGPDGLDLRERARTAGHPAPTGENIAIGYPDANAVMTGWLASTSHRAAIVNCTARTVGIGLARGGAGVPYWTQIFGA